MCIKLLAKNPYVKILIIIAFCAACFLLAAFAIVVVDVVDDDGKEAKRVQQSKRRFELIHQGKSHQDK